MSDDLHGVDRTRRHTSSQVTLVRFGKSIAVTGGFNTSEHAPGEKEERTREISVMKKELKVFASVSDVVWSGRQLHCMFQTPACAPKQDTLPHLLHLWTKM